MGLTVKFFDRRWFWVLIVPTLFYWMIPWQASEPPFTPIQGRVLTLSLVSGGTLLLWLAFRQVRHQKLFGETTPQTNWWLDQLQLLVTTVLVLIVFTLAEMLAKRLPWASYVLHVAWALAGGYGFWRVVYWKES